MQIIVLLHAAITWYLVGLIWVIQVVHYPLMNRVAPEQAVEFALSHQVRMGYIVAAPMLIELALAVLLVICRPAGWPMWLSAVGLGLVLLLWASTFCVQVPLHNQLAHGWDANVHARLVLTNWVRTVAWSIRGVLVGYGVWLCLR